MRTEVRRRLSQAKECRSLSRGASQIVPVALSAQESMLSMVSRRSASSAVAKVVKTFGRISMSESFFAAEYPLIGHTS
jgi:hypothetical protein